MYTTIATLALGAKLKVDMTDRMPSKDEFHMNGSLRPRFIYRWLWWGNNLATSTDLQISAREFLLSWREMERS